MKQLQKTGAWDLKGKIKIVKRVMVWTTIANIIIFLIVAAAAVFLFWNGGNVP